MGQWKDNTPLGWICHEIKHLLGNHTQQNPRHGKWQFKYLYTAFQIEQHNDKSLKKDRGQEKKKLQ